MEISANSAPSARPTDTRTRLVNVQGARGIASLLVVFYHVDKFYFGNPSYWSHTFLDHLFAFGHAGVNFFFVLSGFIIYTAHNRDIGEPSRLLSFAKKRFVRIYPFYWIALAGALVTLFAFPAFGLAKNRDPVSIIGSIFLAGINPLDATIFVSWTLFYEMLFYTLFAFLIASKRVGWTVLIAWWALCAVSSLFFTGAPYPFGTINLLFGMGIGTALLLRHGPAFPGGIAAIFGTVLFLATGIDEVFYHMLCEAQSTLAYGVGSAFALGGVVELERRGKLTAPALLVLSGEASYAIYLTHMLALGVGAKLMRAVGAHHWMPTLPAFAILVLVGAVGGTIAHLFVEKPLLKLSRRLIGV